MAKPKKPHLVDTSDISPDLLDAISDPRFVPQEQGAPSAAPAPEPRTVYNSTAGQVGAGVAGLARGLSMGGTDFAARALGGHRAIEWLHNLEHANPGISTASEAAGNIVPLLFGEGEAAKGGKVAAEGIQEAKAGLEAADSLKAGEGLAKGAVNALEESSPLASGLKALIKGEAKAPAAQARGLEDFQRAVKNAAKDYQAGTPQGRATAVPGRVKAVLEGGATTPGMDVPTVLERGEGAANTVRDLQYSKTEPVGLTPMQRGTPANGARVTEGLPADLGAKAPRVTEAAPNLLDTVADGGPKFPPPRVTEAMPTPGSPRVTEAIPGDQAAKAFEAINESRAQKAFAAEPTPEAAINAYNATKGGTFGQVMRGVGAPNVAVNELGGMVERGVSKLIGSNAESLLGKTLQKVAPMGARGALEGAIYSGAQNLDESILGDHDLNAEKFLAAVGHGALFGGVIGGGLGGASALGREAIGRVAPHIAGLADKEAWKAIQGGRNLGAVRAAKRAGGTEAVGRYALDKGVLEFGENVEGMADKAASNRKAEGEAIEKFRIAADEAGKAGPRVHDIIRDAERSFLKELRIAPGMNAGVINRVEVALGDVARASGFVDAAGEIVNRDARLSFQDAAAWRQRIDAQINWKAQELKPMNEALQKLRGSFEDQTEHALDNAVQEMGGPGRAEYKDLKGNYAKAAVLDDTLQAAVERRSANRTASPSDHAVGIGGALMGAMHGGPFGAAAGLLAGVANHYVRERGPSMAAAILDKIGTLRAIANATEQVDRDIARSVKRVVNGEAAATKPKLRIHPIPEDEQRDHVIASQGSGQHVHERNIQETADEIRAHAPQTAQAFQSVARRATQVAVSSLAPQPPQIGGVHFPMTATAQAKEQDTMSVLHDPVGQISSRMETGTLTVTAVNAFKKAKPNLYAQWANQLKTEMKSTDKQLSYERKLAIATFLQEPVDPSMTPTFMRNMQRTYQQNPAPSKPPAHARPSSHKVGVSQHFQLTGI